MINNIFDIIGKIKEDDKLDLPFIDYYLEDKSHYRNASDKYIDEDNDFLMDDENGILMNFNFIFINTNVFCQVADHFDKYKRYCDFKEGTIEYTQFWKRETTRRRKGMTTNCKLLVSDILLYFNDNTSDIVKESLLKPLRITGTHYNYLNYARIDRTRNQQEIKEALQKGINPNTTIEAFPRFWDGDYWKHKLDEFILRNAFNACDAKARRKGFTFKESNDSAHEFNLNPNTYIIHAAFDSDKYLTRKGALTHLTKRNIDWYENHTYWRRGLVKEDLDNIISGFKKRSEGNKIYGDQSSIISVSLQKNTSAAAGQTAARIKFEESGVNSVLQESLNITMSTTEVGGVKVGNIRIFGTGGTKGANWHDFMNIYYNPKANNMLPMKNIWDYNSRDKACGFFFPQIWCYEPHIDNHGNSKIIDAYYADKIEKDNAKLNLKGEDYLIYLGQRANRPEEAFINTIENLFTSIELTEHIKYLRYSDDAKIYIDGLIINDGKRYLFKSNDELKTSIKTHPFIEDVPFKPKEDITGCIRMYRRPYRNYDGDVPEDLYFITYDTVKVDKDKKEITNKHSLNCFGVWEKPNKYTGNTNYRLVAIYCGRHDTMEECDKLVLNCCYYWNCKLLYEYGTGQTFLNFKRWGKKDRLLKDPTNKLEYKESKGDAGYGIVMGDGQKKLDGLSYLREFIYTPITTNEEGVLKYNLHNILDLPTCMELSSFGLGKNFDRISMLIIAVYYIMAQKLKKEKEVNSSNKKQETLSSILNSFSI